MSASAADPPIITVLKSPRPPAPLITARILGISPGTPKAPKVLPSRSLGEAMSARSALTASSALPVLQDRHYRGDLGAGCLGKSRLSENEMPISAAPLPTSVSGAVLLWGRNCTSMPASANQPSCSATYRPVSDGVGNRSPARRARSSGPARPVRRCRRRRRRAAGAQRESRRRPRRYSGTPTFHLSRWFLLLGPIAVAVTRPLFQSSPPALSALSVDRVDHDVYPRVRWLDTRRSRLGSQSKSYRSTTCRSRSGPSL